MQSLVVVLLWEENGQKAIKEAVGVGVGVLVDLAV